MLALRRCNGEAVFCRLIAAALRRRDVECGPNDRVGLGVRKRSHESHQQQLEDLDPPTAADFPTCTFDELPSRAVGVDAIRVLISDAIVMNACSTLVADLADVCTIGRRGTQRANESRERVDQVYKGSAQAQGWAGLTALGGGAHLEEWDCERVGEFLRRLCFDLLLRDQVRLVANQQFVDALL